MAWLLDSNAVIALMAHVPAVEQRVVAAAPGELLLSSIVAFELTFGAYNSRRVDENPDRLDDLAFPVIDFDADDARCAGEIRAALRQLGTPIGPYDVLIAGQALARDLTLVTANIGEFARVAGLRVENWLAD